MTRKKAGRVNKISAISRRDHPRGHLRQTRRVFSPSLYFSLRLCMIDTRKKKKKSQEGNFLLSLVYSSWYSARYNIMKRVWVGRRLVCQNRPQFLLAVISIFFFFYPRRIFTGVSRSMRGTKRDAPVRFALKIRVAFHHWFEKFYVSRLSPFLTLPSLHHRVCFSLKKERGGGNPRLADLS